MQQMSQAQITAKVADALASCGYLSTFSLARGLGCQPWQVVDAFDVMEADGTRLQRTRGPSGGAAIVRGKRTRKAA